MILNLISLDTVKAHLGINETTYNTAITTIIPIVSSDIRRILNNNFNNYITASFSSGSTAIILYQEELNSQFSPKYEMGQVIYHPNLPVDTYLQSYNPGTGFYILSVSATGAGDYIYPTITIAMWPAISKMIWYKYTKQNVTAASEKNVTSESYGPVSVQYAQNEINSQWDYPQKLIDDLGVPFARVG